MSPQNPEGLTFEEWWAAATVTLPQPARAFTTFVEKRELQTSWELGVDPTKWVHYFQNLKETHETTDSRK